MSDDNSLASIQLIPTALDPETPTTPDEGVPRVTPDETPAPTETAPESAAEGKEPEAEAEKDLSTLPLPGDEVKNQKEVIPKWVEKKLSRKDMEYKQKEAEAAAYRAQLESIAAAQQQIPQQVSIDPEAPQKDAFANEGDYIAAVVAHTNRRTQERVNHEAGQRAVIEQEQRFQTNLKQKLEKGKDKYEDFEEKIKPMFSQGFPANRAMAEAIGDSDYSEDMLYFLGQNINEAEKIARLNPIQAVKKIAELEARFKARQTPQITKAPAPIASINSNQGHVKTVDNLEDLIKNASKMSQAEFEAAYKVVTAKSNPAW